MNQGLIPIIGRPYVTGIYSAAAAVGGGALIASETDGMGIDFTYATAASQMRVTTASVAVDSNPSTTLTYTSPSLKLARQSDGVYRYGNHNLALRSETFDNAAWTKTASTVTADSIAAPDGTITADTLLSDGSASGVKGLIAAATIAIDRTQATIQVRAKGGLGFQWFYIAGTSFGTGGTGKAWFDLTNGVTGTNGTGGTVSIASLGNGWYLCTVTAATSASTFIPQFRLADADNSANATGTSAQGIYVWGAEAKKSPIQNSTTYIATTTVAKFSLPYEWDVSGNPLGILIEEQRTNLLLRSQEFDNASWTKDANTTAVANAATAPDGTTTGDKLTENTVSSSEHITYQGVTATAAAYTFSVFLKAAERTQAQVFLNNAGDNGINVNLSTGAVGTTIGTITSSSVTDAGNGWWRVSVVKTLTVATWNGVVCPTNADSATRASYAGTVNSGIYVWGAQIELNAFPTSPIHTTSATVTRAVDDITLANSAFPWSNATGSAFVQWAIAGFSSGNAAGVLANVTNGRPVYASYGVGVQNVRAYDGVNAPSPGNIAATIGATMKTASSWGGNLSISTNGAAVTSTAFDGTMGTGVTLLIGKFDGTSYLNGWLQKIIVLNREWSDAELLVKST